MNYLTGFDLVFWWTGVLVWFFGIVLAILVCVGIYFDARDQVRDARRARRRDGNR